MKNIFKMLNPKNFKATAERFGTSSNTSQFLIIILAVAAGMFLVCKCLKLMWYYIIAVCVFSVILAPSIMLTFYKNKYENLRFEHAVDYCEQMIYSFRKKQKIRVALEDVSNTLNGRIKEIVLQVLDYIDKGDAETNLYEEGLKMVKDEYDCSRIETLHSYLVEVESNGGDSRRALSILLNDVREWSTRTLVYQRKREDVRKKVGISIVLALFTCSMMFNFIPAEYVDSIINNQIYQICTVFVLVACELVFLYISGKIGDTYLDNEQRKSEIKNAMYWVHKLEAYDKKKERRNTIMFTVICFGAGAVCYILDLGYISFVPPAFGLYFIFDYMTKLGTYKKRITKEINIVFPIWLRNLILHLQTDNVHVALANSLKTCPDVMKPEVRNLVIGISNNPNSIVPYMNFMKDYNLPEFKSAIRFLYSLAEFGSDDMVTQLDQLVQQNAILAAAAEDLRNESSLTLLGTLTYAPMLISCVKLLVDMGLFFTTFMGYMGSMGEMPGI